MISARNYFEALKGQSKFGQKDFILISRDIFVNLWPQGND